MTTPEPGRFVRVYGPGLLSARTGKTGSELWSVQAVRPVDWTRRGLWRAGDRDGDGLADVAYLGRTGGIILNSARDGGLLGDLRTLGGGPYGQWGTAMAMARMTGMEAFGDD